MSKLKQLSGWILAAFVPLAMSVPAAAEGTCQIGYTGPNSDNMCTSKQQYTCTIVNNNNVSIDNQNLQVAVTGSATNSTDTNSGDARTGSATNSNNVTFNATVTNTGVCTAVASVPATNTPPPVGGSGAAGGGSGSVATPTAVTKQSVQPTGGSGSVVPTVLADTGAVNILPLSLGVLSVGAAILMIAKLLIASNA